MNPAQGPQCSDAGDAQTGGLIPDSTIMRIMYQNHEFNYDFHLKNMIMSKVNIKQKI